MIINFIAVVSNYKDIEVLMEEGRFIIFLFSDFKSDLV